MIFQRFTGGIAALSVIVGSFSVAVSPAMAVTIMNPADCTCVIPGATAARISEANGSVFITGVTSQQKVAGAASAAIGSEVSVGSDGSANLTVGNSCNLALNGSLSGSFRVAVNNLPNSDMCVQVLQDGVAAGEFPVGIAAGVTLAVGTALVVGVGLSKPASLQ